jgi:dethiobiotin synthetase
LRPSLRSSGAGCASMRYVVAGTDTGVGKTVFSAALASALDADYWKPVQSGLDGETDSETVARLGGLSEQRIIPEAYRLKLPASPNISAAREGVIIDALRLAIPKPKGPLIIEGAGGLIVPLATGLLQIDLFMNWGLPVILCARTALGTINHTLLSIEAMQRRSISIHGVAFSGPRDEEAERAIITHSGVNKLGGLPPLHPLDAGALAEAFAANFKLSDF